MKQKSLKWMSLLVALMMLLSLCSLALAEDSLEKVKKAGKLVVGTSPDYAPYEFPGPDGKPVGADMVLAQFIADKLGVELVIEELDFDGVLAAIATGKIDLALAGIDPTEERKASMDFSDVYYNESNQIILIQKDNAEAYGTLAGLAGKTIAAQNGTVQETMVKEYLKESKLELITKVPDGIMMLLGKKVDAMALPNVVAEQYVKNYPDLVIANEKFPYSSIGIAAALTKGKPELLAAINEVIKEVVEQKLFYGWMEEAVELNNSLNK